MWLKTNLSANPQEEKDIHNTYIWQMQNIWSSPINQLEKSSIKKKRGKKI